MSSDDTNKALLFDEKEIERFLGSSIDSFEQLRRGIVDYTTAHLGPWELPWAWVLGCASERFGSAGIVSDDYPTLWVKEEGSWDKTLINLCDNFWSIGPEAMQRFLEDGDQDKLTAGVKRRMIKNIEEGVYNRVSSLSEAMVNMRNTGLPCVADGSDFCSDLVEGAFDMRQKNHGAGSRVLVEFIFVWAE